MSIAVSTPELAPVGPRPPASAVSLLLRLRYTTLRNSLRQALRHRPLKLIGSSISILLIWAGLYFLLRYTFAIMQRQVLEGIVATPLIFTFFFLALTVMLAFSTAILSYGTLFRRPESTYLVASPLHPRDIVIVKHIESLVMASWSLVLLGIPLMLAMADTFDEPLAFYPLFLGLFLLFIPIPGALGLVLAWLVALIFPRTPRRTMVLAGLLLCAVAGRWFWGLYSIPTTTDYWLNRLYERISLVQGAFLPHTWVSKGINHAVQGQTAEAGFYLFVTVANALFFTTVAVGIVSAGFMPAFAKAQVSGSRGVRRTGLLISWIADVMFAYLPWRLRLLAAKDLKSFFRDPLQWSQMAILIGLLALYVSNVQRLWADIADSKLQLLIAFLNQTAVRLILATFTNRFVFPLVSLDGQQLWLLGLLPLPRSRIILAKFLYALTITVLTATAVMGVSVVRLALPQALAVSHLVCSVAICIGLCGMSIGIGARMPVFHERNPARIAGGFGGTVSLLLSIGIVVLSLVGMGVMSAQALRLGGGDILTPSMLAWLGGVVVLNVTTALIAMTIGIRHFTRLEV